MPPARIAFYVATVIVLVVTARAILGEPSSIVMVGVLATLYITLVMLGVLLLPLRVFVDALIQGPRGSKGVVLTFDDGPDPISTKHALETLDAAGAKATFFVIGKKAEAHPEVVREILARGHTVALHSYAHDRLFALRGPRWWRRDLQKGKQILEELTGEPVRWFRPPIGHTVPHTPRILRDLKLRVIGWNVSARDGTRTRPDDVADRVLSRVRDGSIVLLHDASERGTHEPAGVAALPKILAGLKSKGIGVVPLSDWI